MKRLLSPIHSARGRVPRPTIDRETTSQLSPIGEPARRGIRSAREEGKTNRGRFLGLCEGASKPNQSRGVRRRQPGIPHARSCHEPLADSASGAGAAAAPSRGARRRRGKASEGCYLLVAVVGAESQSLARGSISGSGYRAPVRPASAASAAASSSQEELPGRRKRPRHRTEA